MSIAMLRLSAPVVVNTQLSFSINAATARDLSSGDSDPQGLQILFRAFATIGGAGVVGAYATIRVDVYVPGDGGSTLDYQEYFELGPTAGVDGIVTYCPVESYPYNVLVQVTITEFEAPEGYVFQSSPPIEVQVINRPKDTIESYCL
jgi:hypothetical protein